MNSTMQDVIEREIVLRAPKERVYAAISEPDQITQWFPDKVEGSLTPGERPVFEFEGYGKAPTLIIAADPYHYFAYKWIPGGVAPGYLGDVLEKPHTLVEFMLEDIPDGTKLTLKESGFASLPSEVYAEAFKDNNNGWDYMLDRLVKLISG